ncbi:MAG: hypothetical protein K0S31_1464 [Sphingobacterium multivorum]|nr:hypothetical protein [Sphingobacterium multivorum]
MRTKMIIGINTFSDSEQSLTSGLKDLIKLKFRFENTIEALRDRVFISLTIFSHADNYVVFRIFLRCIKFY